MGVFYEGTSIVIAGYHIQSCPQIKPIGTDQFPEPLLPLSSLRYVHTPNYRDRESRGFAVSEKASGTLCLSHSFSPIPIPAALGKGVHQHISVSFIACFLFPFVAPTGRECHKRERTQTVLAVATGPLCPPSPRHRETTPKERIHDRT